ncbi:zinc finger protein 862-like [Montipora capricornis]|uniref:zinc finger protein 862-like n=1 Tax=Montipora capricornis TaxID=246305 RepID=UPI0035F13556
MCLEKDTICFRSKESMRRSHYFRVLVAKELYFNAEVYANHEIFKVTEGHSGIPESVLFPVALSKDGDRILTAGGSQADAAPEQVPVSTTSREANRSGSKQGSILSFFKSSPGAPELKGIDNSTEKRTTKRAELDEGKQPPPKSAVKRKFLPHWKEEFPWVVFHENLNNMTCEICCSVPELAGKSEFLTGSCTFKKETLQKHGVSGPHLRARDGLLAKQKPLKEAPIAQSLQKGKKAVEEQNRNEMAVKINTAYFIAKEELPFSKFGPILSLQKKNGRNINLTYANDNSCATLVSLVSSVITDQLASAVNDGSKYLSIMIDGATDSSGIENETVHCRFVKDGQPVNRLVGHQPVAHGHAQGVLETVNGAFSDVGISQWKEKLVGMGFDGASVNIGKKGGVAALLRREVPHVIDFHCLPHRLELALLEMQKSCKLVSTIYDVLQLIWKTYHFSPKSMRKLQSIGTELGVNVLKPTQVRGTRWLPHISRALKVLVMPGKDGSGQYFIVVYHMDHLSTTSKNADIKGRANFFYS